MSNIIPFAQRIFFFFLTMAARLNPLLSFRMVWWKNILILVPGVKKKGEVSWEANDGFPRQKVNPVTRYRFYYIHIQVVKKFIDNEEDYKVFLIRFIIK